MKFFTAKLAVFAIFVLLIGNAYAADDGFLIENIELINARRISLATVLNHMPVGVGDYLTPSASRDTVVALYDTGFFKDISLARRGNTLLIQVKERPAITDIVVDGNSKLKDENIEQILDQIGLVAGAIYNDQVLDSLQKEMERAYYGFGRYGVKLTTRVTPLPRNRVKIEIDIAEGVPSKIKSINIIGNNTYASDEILDNFEMGIPAWWQLFSNKDQYAKERFYDDIKSLETFYTSRGYINYKVNSVQVTISPDKKDIYISISISEGEQYTVNKASITGDTVIDKEQLLRIIERVNVSGEFYSSEKTTDTIEYIENRLGGIGYAFSKVELRTSKNDAEKTVDLNFVVDPGKRVYVRKIRFVGNEKANDEVYRREMRQLEGAWYSKFLVERSKTRVERLPFVEEAKIDTPEVAGTDDQVDVLLDVKERLAGSFNAGLGYSDAYKLSFNLGLQHSNVFGMGNTLSVAASSSRVLDSLSFSYTDPYATDAGVARTFSLAFSEYNTSETARIPFLQNTKRAGLTYLLPVSEYSSVNLGAYLSVTDIPQIVTSQVSEINDFIADYGQHHEQLMMNLGYIYDTRNRTIFPDRGIRQSVGISYSTAGSDLSYYKIRHSGNYYWPTFWGTVFRIRHEVVIGAGRNNLDELPFYEKMSTGGVNSVRGFESRSLGPRGTLQGTPFPTDSTLGGDLLTTGSMELIIKPTKAAEGSARLVIFFDAGNAFETRNDFNTSELRSSFGVAFRWLAPLGAMTFSYAEPIKRQRAVPANGIEGDPAQWGIRADKVKRFDFNVGGTF